MSDREPVCGAPKDGGYRLHCELPPGHEPDWHKSSMHNCQEITYLGSHHVIEMTETVTWEPVDHVREAVSRIMQSGNANPVATRHPPRTQPPTADETADTSGQDETVPAKPPEEEE